VLEAISGNAAVHWFADRGSQILLTGQTVTCTGSPALSSAFVAVTNLSIFGLNGISFSGCGSVTGTRFIADYLSTFGGTDPNTFPGNPNGTYT